jgi:hypothetical protein
VAVITALIVFAWYPHPFFQFSENGKSSLLLIGFAGIIGPCLTWLVYKDDKPKFIFDVVVIVLIQTAAIWWATSALYLQRPYFMVFTVDRFEVLARSDIDIELITDPGFLDKPVAGVIMLYAAMPTDIQAYSKLVRETVLEGKPDLQYRPAFWNQYEDKQHLAVQAAQPLELLRSKVPESTESVDQWIRDNGGDVDRYKFVPATGRSGDFAAILEAVSGKLVDGIMTDPWID